MRSLLALLFAAAAVTLGAADSAQPKIEGTWKWTFNMPDGTRAEPKARLKREDGALTGTSIPRPGMSVPITDLKVHGDKISWTVVRDTNGRKVTTRYAGRIKDDKISGTIESDWSGQPQTYDWSAKRAPDTPEGTWKWETAFGQARFESTVKLELEGKNKNKLKGKAKLRTTEVDIKEGKYKNGEISFDVVRERDGEEFVTSYRGKLDGDTIVGETEFEFGGETRTREWIATRADD
jgi:hypothetical protein